MGKLFPVDDLTRRRATEADITRESPFGDLRLVRPNNLAATGILRITMVINASVMA